MRILTRHSPARVVGKAHIKLYVIFIYLTTLKVDVTLEMMMQ